jgi:hypothetical protein
MRSEGRKEAESENSTFLIQKPGARHCLKLIRSPPIPTAYYTKINAGLPPLSWSSN